MKTTGMDKRIWTSVSEDGKSAAAGMSLGPVLGVKTGGGYKPQSFGPHGWYLGPLHAANTHARTATDAGGRYRRSPLGQGTARGQRVGKRYVLPPNVIEENKHIALVYSQSSGELTDMEDRLLGKGYSGAPGYVNVPDSQGKKDLGVIPEGTWAIGSVVWDSTETGHKGENLIHLVPDAATAERVRAMGRDPNTFYIHAGKINGERTASQGCIIMEKPERKALRELQGAKIRVVR
jgi:hypothetical protein